LDKTTGSAPVLTFRLGAFAAAANDSGTETANESQSKSDTSPKVNFARLFCEMDGFRIGLEDDWEFDSGKPEFTFGDGELGGWRAGSGGDVDEFVGGEHDGRGGNGGELSEDGVKRGGDLGSDLNSGSVLSCGYT
jgi:hypothetical protein